MTDLLIAYAHDAFINISKVIKFIICVYEDIITLFILLHYREYQFYFPHK